MLFVSALAFLLGVYTDAPLGAVGGAVVLVIVSNILDAVPALGSLREVLPDALPVLLGGCARADGRVGLDDAGRGLLIGLQPGTFRTGVAALSS